VTFAIAFFFTIFSSTYKQNESQTPQIKAQKNRFKITAFVFWGLFIFIPVVNFLIVNKGRNRALFPGYMPTADQRVVHKIKPYNY